MELLIKKTIKILSFQEQNCLEVSQIIPQLLPLINCVNRERFIQRLKECPNIKMDDSKKDKILLSLNRDQAKEANDEKQLNLFFKEDKTNKSLYYLYRLILKAGPAGINYSDLSTQFNKQYVKDKPFDSKGAKDLIQGQKSNKISQKQNGSDNKDGEDYEKDIKKLDITNVSHYCRKLYTLKFINILPEKVCKKAVATKFQEKCLQIDVKTKRKQMMTSQINTEMDLEDIKKQQFTKLSIVSDPWRYLKEDTFIVNELTFTQNILLNFASYEAFLREGLLQTEIASKINKLGERKMLVRSLENIIEDYKVQSTADRQGRTFSLKFHIKSQVMADYIDALFKDNKINIKQELEDMQRLHPLSQLNISEGSLQIKQKNGNGQGGIQTHLQFTSAQNNENKESRHLKIKIEEKSQSQNNQNNYQNGQVMKQNEEINKSALDTVNKNNENIQSFTKRSELFNQNPKLNYASFEHIYKYFQDNEKLVQDLMHVAEKEFIKKCMKVPPTYEDNDYVRFSELLLKIINETVEFTYVRTKKGPDGNAQVESTNSNKRVSKKQISRNKLNRYIYIFNRIEEKKVIKNLKLKKYIIGLEKNQGVGEIDKKTLEHILNTFQYIHYINVKKIKIDIDTISQNIVRSIIIHKDIPENDPRVIKAEKTINKGLLKKGPKKEESDESDSESDSVSNFQSQSQLQQKQQSKLQVIKSNGTQGKAANEKQSDITSFLIKRQRNIQPNQKIYYYDEEDNENQDSSTNQLDPQSVKSEYNPQIQSLPPKKSILQAQLQEALAKVTKENCEIPAGPEKMKILASLIFQFMEKKLKKNYKEAFDKLSDINYSTIYTNLYFKQNQVEFKYPLFQQNLCKNLLQLSQNTRKYPELMELELETLDTLDMNSAEVPSVDQLLNEAFISPNSENDDEQEISLQSLPLHKIIDIEDAKQLISQNNQNNFAIEKLKIGLGELKGKEIKNQKGLMQDSILKFKSYLLRYPCRKLVDTKMRYQMVDYFSFLNQCVYNNSIKFFKLNKESNSFEKAAIEEITIDTIDSIFYQITNNYYNHFNLSSSNDSSQIE